MKHAVRGAGNAASSGAVVDVDDPPTGTLACSVISARGCEGLLVKTVDGRPATLAVLDREGHIVESGPDVVQEVWNVAVLAYRNFLKGEGCLTVSASPEGLFQDEAPVD